MSTKNAPAPKDVIDPDPTVEERVAILEEAARKHGWDLTPPSDLPA